MKNIIEKIYNLAAVALSAGIFYAIAKDMGHPWIGLICFVVSICALFNISAIDFADNGGPDEGKGLGNE